MITEIPPVDALEKLKNNEAILIDVREQEEWDDHRIAGAVHMPLSKFHNDVDTIDSQGKDIVFHCLMGGRSLKAAMHYVETQNPNHAVYNMTGGIKLWVELGFEVTS